MWKRKKEIEGVSNSSILSLKSIVANEERELKKLQEEGLIKPKKISKHNINDSTSNRGINERIERDKQDQSTIDELENSRKRLVEKSKLYNSIVNQDLFSNEHELQEVDQDSTNSRNIIEKFKYDRNEENVIDFKEKSFITHQERLESAEQLKSKAMSEQDYMKKFWEDQKDDQDDNNEEEDDEFDLEYIEKQQRIQEMKKIEEETKLEREKALKVKHDSQSTMNERLDKINQLKRLNELKKKLSEKQQSKK